MVGAVSGWSSHREHLLWRRVHVVHLAAVFLHHRDELGLLATSFKPTLALDQQLAWLGNDAHWLCLAEQGIHSSDCSRVWTEASTQCRIFRDVRTLTDSLASRSATDQNLQSVWANETSGKTCRRSQPPDALASSRATSIALLSSDWCRSARLPEERGVNCLIACHRAAGGQRLLESEFAQRLAQRVQSPLVLHLLSA